MKGETPRTHSLAVEGRGEETERGGCPSVFVRECPHPNSNRLGAPLCFLFLPVRSLVRSKLMRRAQKEK